MLAGRPIPCWPVSWDNLLMRAQNKWAIGLVGGVVVLVGAAVAGLAQWAGSADFRLRAQQAATQALGVPVQLGEIEITYWPALGVAVHDVRVLTRPALTLAQIDATPVWTSVLMGKPALDALVVRNAVLPQQGILAAVAALQKQAPNAAAKNTDPAANLPRRIELDQVTWVDASRQRLTVNAEIAFAGELLPDTAKVDIVGGRYAGAKARLDREGDAWQLRADIGGGTLTGPLRLQSQKGGGWRLTGDVTTEKVEVAALTAPSRALTASSARGHRCRPTSRNRARWWTPCGRRRSSPCARRCCTASISRRLPAHWASAAAARRCSTRSPARSPRRARSCS